MTPGWNSSLCLRGTGPDDHLNFSFSCPVIASSCLLFAQIFFELERSVVQRPITLSLILLL
jgi:hypothetical protein